MNQPNGNMKLVLITDEFPYTPKEASFLAPELPELAERFEVTLLSKSDAKNPPAPVDGRIRVLHYHRPHALLHAPFFIALPFCRDFRQECARIRREKAKKPFLNALLAGYFIIEAWFFQRYLLKSGLAGKGCDTRIFYSYWNNYAVYALTRLKEKGLLGGARVVTRTHGYDLYDPRQLFSRQPMKQATDRSLDRVYFVSEQGRQYYLKRFASADDAFKYRLFRLGTADCGLAPVPAHKGLSILTVSSTAPVKRLPLLIEALSRLSAIPVTWTHFGGGAELPALKALAEELLSGRADTVFSFCGALEHGALMERLKAGGFDCIVNVSSSEGLPVSIMEAASFGIPAIATDVGGTREAFMRPALFLLPADSTAEEIAVALTAFYALPEADKAALRKATRAHWEGTFNAEKNARAFAEELRLFAIEK